MFRPRRFYLSILGAVACSATAADTVLRFLDAASLSFAQVSVVGLAIAASALDVVALCCVGLFAFQFAWKREGVIKRSLWGLRLLVIFCVLPSLSASMVSLASIAVTRSRSKELSSKTSKGPIKDWDSHLAAQVIIWILAFVSQNGLFAWSLFSKPEVQPQPSIATSCPRDSVMSEVRHSHQTTDLYMLEATQPSSPLAALPSPTFSARSSQSLRSWRESLQQVVRPVTSRSRLINRPSFTRDSGSLHSVDTISQFDGFESWDTSSVDPQTKDTIIQSAPSRGTALAPIPGSRPASPARALDGPFPVVPEDEELEDLAPPPKMLPDTSRPPSPSVSEGHIHPLFRSESPTPPPAATPGTNILASPLANQMIACPPRPYSRMRSNSRTASPSPLMHSHNMPERSISSQRSQRSQRSERSSRSPSPPSRAMTPPIPDFVLNSSPRSSINSRRKVSLQAESTR
ncbi:hypothetical protein BS50DRAFT_350121 [Corynespora cassiicola Philippines]|uniref:Uncharacterized protein n=1 Tax=Corynespora cassiicola Philippines TaxID=1448308 RepID=A0A2T2NQZ4_CORCC|nr:hypothetical protein BS50DRAFT_350121 [Corynespora cassiicola Philippines]